MTETDRTNFAAIGHHLAIVADLFQMLSDDATITPAVVEVQHTHPAQQPQPPANQAPQNLPQFQPPAQPQQTAAPAQPSYPAAQPTSQPQQPPVPQFQAPPSSFTPTTPRMTRNDIVLLMKSVHAKTGGRAAAQITQLLGHYSPNGGVSALPEEAFESVAKSLRGIEGSFSV